MSQVQQTFNTRWPGSGPGATFTRPTNLISPLIQVVAIGGNTTAQDISGPFPAALRYGAQVSGSFDPALCPLTIVVGSPGFIYQTGISPIGGGGNGFSGGGGAGGQDFPAVNSGVDGGGGSTGILTSASGSPAVLIEAAGSDSAGLLNPFIAGGHYMYGGTGGGISSNTPSPDVNGGVGTSHIVQSGSGGSSGGSGGTGYNGYGQTAGVGGTGFGIVGSGANGNNASSGAPGAGVGSGGLPDPNNITGKSFADTTRVQFVGIADATTTAQAVFTYRVADAPLAPTPVSPSLGQYVDGHNMAQTFTGIYNAPSGDSGALEGVVLRLIHGVTTQYWDGHALVSSPVVITPTTGFAAINGGQFSVTIPPGFLVDGSTYTYAFATVESLVGLQGPFSAPQSFNSVMFPSVTITAPTEGQFVATLTPTISWTDVIPSGSQISSRVVIYQTSLAPSTPSVSADPLAIYDVIVASATTSRAIPFTAIGTTLPLVSITGYSAFVMITSTGSAPSTWARVDFTIELQSLAPPTLVAIPSIHPPSGMAAPHLTMTARDNLASTTASDMEGVYVPFPGVVGTNSTRNVTVSPYTAAPIAGGTSLACQCGTGGGTMAVSLAQVEASPGNVFYGQCVTRAIATGRAVQLTVNWYDNTNTIITTQTLVSTTEIALAPLFAAGASGAAPAGTVYGELMVSWTLCAANEVHLVDSVAWNNGSASSPWYEGIGLFASPETSAASLSEFQADYIGDGSWQDIVTDEVPVALDIVGSGSQSMTYDVGAPFGTPLNYRVRNLVVKPAYTTGGINYPEQLVVSPWSSTVAVAAGAQSKNWWIVPPTQPNSSMLLHRLPSSGSASGTSSNQPALPSGLTASFISDEQEQLGVFHAFGKSTAIVVHGDIWAPEFDLDLYFESTAEWEAFRAIRDLQTVVLLKSDMESTTYWVTLGPDLNPGIIKRSDRTINPTRGLTIHCTPTDPYVPVIPL